MGYIKVGYFERRGVGVNIYGLGFIVVGLIAIIYCVRMKKLKESVV